MWDLPGPGLEPGPPALGAQSLSHWTTREVLTLVFLNVSVVKDHFKHFKLLQTNTFVKYNKNEQLE